MKKTDTTNIRLIIDDFFDNYSLEELRDTAGVAECVQHIAKEIEPEVPIEIISKLVAAKMPVEPKVYSAKELEGLKKQLVGLKNIKQPAQRSEEWYEFRNNRLTASDLATAIGENPYGNMNKLIASKCGYKNTFIPGAAIIHGVKYEPMATLFYERLNNVSVYEYGCLPHPTIGHFAASPDGICDYGEANKHYTGRMLEIKCPKSRKLNGYIPGYYELQIQGQLEVCDLEFCDYLECDIQECSKNDFYKIEDSKFRGLVFIAYDLKEKKEIYYYKTDNLTMADNDQWIQDSLGKIMENENMEYNGVSYFYIHNYDIILVKRDQERFKVIKEKIDKFWNEVLKFREIGYESLLPKKKEYKKPTNTKVKHSFIDSD
jgi:putative phage-type endonuclease